MKKVFSKKYLMNNRGCYSEKDVKAIPCYSNRITLKKLHNEIPIKDFLWFFVYKCELTTKQQQLFALECSRLVLPNFEKFAPNDDRVRKCIEYTEKFINGEITKQELESAAESAESAARSAKSAAWSAESAAWSAESAARSAAESAAWSAESAAWSAESAARSAAESAEFKEFIWGIVEGIKNVS